MLKRPISDADDLIDALENDSIFDMIFEVIE